MPPTYSDSVRCTIETCLRAGVEPLQIASEVRVSHQWVYKLRQVLDAFGTVSPPHLGVQGRPRKITVEAEEGLLDLGMTREYSLGNTPQAQHPLK
jgi:hypothetical protein